MKAPVKSKTRQRKFDLLRQSAFLARGVKPCKANLVVRVLPAHPRQEKGTARPRRRRKVDTVAR